jgi:hypothetical protein
MSWEAQAAVWKMKGLKPGQKWVLMGLANYANQDNECWPSLDKLSENLCMTKVRVIANITALIEMEIVGKERESHYGVNHYQLNLVTGKENETDNRKQVKKVKLKQVKKVNPILLSESLLKEEKPLSDSKDESDPPVSIQEFVESWNEEFAEQLPRVTLPLSDKRKRKLQARLREHPAIEYWSIVFTKIGSSPFLLGSKGNGWRASFDWLINNSENCMKIVEGNYDAKNNAVRVQR